MMNEASKAVAGSQCEYEDFLKSFDGWKLAVQDASEME